jgi:hypothetical protein
VGGGEVPVRVIVPGAVGVDGTWRSADRNYLGCLSFVALVPFVPLVVPLESFDCLLPLCFCFLSFVVPSVCDPSPALVPEPPSE